MRKYNSRAKKEMKFGLFRMQSDMTLGAFYEQFVEHRRTRSPHPKREAQNFLLRLDERYAEMITSMVNGQSRKKSIPRLSQRPTR